MTSGGESVIVYVVVADQYGDGSTEISGVCADKVLANELADRLDKAAPSLIYRVEEHRVIGL